MGGDCEECGGSGQITIGRLRRLNPDEEMKLAGFECESAPADTFPMPPVIDAEKEIYSCPSCSTNA